MQLSVITVTWNSKEKIAEQIRSVRSGCKNISYEHIIVDNASSDGTGEYIKKEFPEVRFIQNRKNVGFGAANNQAAKETKGEFLLFLNPDMRVAVGSLDTIVNWMRERPKVGVTSCLLTKPGGAVNEEAFPRRFPGFLDQFATIIKLQGLFKKSFDRYLFKEFSPRKEQMVDSVRGSFMLMRREVYNKLGWAFDPRYYIWFEDVDTCREVWKHGFTVMYTPIISCVDYIGQSFKQRASFWKYVQFTKSMVIYFKKWEPMHVWLPLALTRALCLPLAWVYLRFKK